MKPQQEPVPDPSQTPNTLTKLRPGEHEVCTIKRHPIGIIGIYAMCGLVAVVTAVLAFGLAPDVFGGGDSRQAMLAGALVFIAVAVACVVFALITTTVYWGNTWTLTSDSLTQVKRLSLFKRHSTQLSLDDVEDVTSEQNGILTRIFDYGLLRVETANERAHLIFPFCPNSNYYAAQILEAKETFEEQRHREENTYQQPAPPVQQPQPPAYTPPVAPAAQPPEPEIVSYEVPGGPDGSV